jgi:hypothetical protein
VKCFWRKRTDQRWDAGVGASGGQPGRSAKAWRSLAVVQPCDIQVSLGVRLKSTQDGGGSRPEERHGLAAEIHKIDRRRKIPVFSDKQLPYPTSFEAWRLDQRVRPTSPLVGTQLSRGGLRQGA